MQKNKNIFNQLAVVIHKNKRNAVRNSEKVVQSWSVGLQLQQKDQNHMLLSHCYYCFQHAALWFNQGLEWQQETHPLTFMRQN